MTAPVSNRKNVWTSVTSLDFNDEDFNTTENGCYGSDLKQLKLVLCDCYYAELLAEGLKRSANLKDLFLESVKCYHKCSEPQWNPPGFVPICLLSHATTIAIRGFKQREIEMELATYLLKNGRVLDKMIIDTSYLQMTEELCEKFAMFQRGSVACEVEFIKM